MPILLHPVQPPFVMPPPDGQLYSDTLADDSYDDVNLMQHDGLQATFDIFGDGQTTQGLRVTIERGTNRISVESNGFTVSFSTGAATVTLTSADGTVEIAMPDGSALSAYKTAIDAIAGLNSDYFGGETGTSTIATTDDVPDTVSAGATPDRPALMMVQATQNVLAFVGTSAPTNNNGSRFLRGGDVDKYLYIPPGNRLWLIRQGGNDAAGSASLWIVTGGG